MLETLGDSPHAHRPTTVAHESAPPCIPRNVERLAQLKKSFFMSSIVCSGVLTVWPMVRSCSYSS